MCGIAAIVGRSAVSSEDGWAMIESIRHRGPDGLGVATIGDEVSVAAERGGASDRGRVVLAHARLAIIDTSAAGFQPMTDETGRVWMIVNGEIFNFRALRAELEAAGHRFHSQTDSEVLVHGWEEWGEGLLDRVEGMYAFVLHDREADVTLLARDRLGVKPLYFATRPDGALAVASEIKALFASGVPAALDAQGLDTFLRWLWVPDPETAFAGVQKLMPGHALLVDRFGKQTLRRYWNLEYDVDPAFAGPAGAGRLREALEQAISRQLVADVPVGAFFSGGLDSTTIVELMRRERIPDSTTCFTIGFSERDLAHDVVDDDLRYARLYANAAGIDYRESILEPDLVDVLPKVVWHMDEPVADPAALSAYHISRAASSGFTVLLSGMGGDEIFGGYPRYRAAELARHFRRAPEPLRALAQRAVLALPGAGAGRLATIGRNSQKLLAEADRQFPHDYLSFLTYFDDAARTELYSPAFAEAVGSADAARRHNEHLGSVPGEHWLHQAMYLDAKTYLPALNLTYMDKMSMAHSIEVRVPLIDELVLDVMRRVPPDAKLDGLRTKVLFKQAVKGLVPEQIIRRRKAGFSAPVRGWLAHELRPLVDDVLSASTIRRRGLFDPAAVTRLLADFRAGRRDTALQIWQLLTLELWQEEFLDGKARRPAVAI